ncbi:amidohydrolase family protein [Robertkochia aurantiaca]|uniref:amidohydrolase family protein n=1 Tax=Robertkochia aurantiaca TaxID=2873700 RepID=UPI001CCF7FCF|nr:amidohydrolase family protein [Robertkochia sp. 3YJGBD-33]
MNLYINISGCILFLFLGFHNSKAQSIYNPTHQSDSMKKSEVTAYVIRNVNIITLKPKNEIIQNVNLLIENGVITGINKPVPKNATIIEATGKWVMPGLIDMHVHGLADIDFGEKYPTKPATIFFDTQDFMLLYIANGITTTFELNARAEHIAQRNEIAGGKAIGPRMALAKLLDGGRGFDRVNTPEAGKQAVRSAKAEGYEFIKVYSHLSESTFNAIVQEARELNMKVIGHIPDTFKGRTEEAVSRISMVAHAEEFAKQADTLNLEKAEEFAEMALKHDLWLTTTLIVMERMAEQARTLETTKSLAGFELVHPLMQSKWIVSNKNYIGSSPQRVNHLEDLAEFNKVLVGAFHKAGVPMVAGTDSGSSGVIWGYALHDELHLLEQAGLSPEQTLAAATRLPAEWLGIDHKVGTVEEGKLADLLILEANPLKNLENLQKMAGIFVDGKYLSNDEIQQMLQRLHLKNERIKSDYDWRDRREF